ENYPEQPIQCEVQLRALSLTVHDMEQKISHWRMPVKFLTFLYDSLLELRAFYFLLAQVRASSHWARAMRRVQGVVNLFALMPSPWRRMRVLTFPSRQAAIAGTVISRQIWNLFFSSCRYAGAENLCRRGRKCWVMGS